MPPSRPGGLRHPTALGLLGWSLALGCPTADPEPGSDPTPARRSDRTLADYAADGALGVGVRTLELDDADRVTPASGTQPELPSRRLTVEVWYPSADGSVGAAARDAKVSPGPHPLVVWSHGFTSTRLDSPKLAMHLASHGYVFAAVQFPLSARGTSAGTPDASDVVNQPGDVSFVLDTLLADPDFATEDIAAGGISLGGLTTLLVGLDPELSDPRFDALLPLTPATCPLPLDALVDPTPPLLLAHGTSDAILPFEDHARPFFEATTGPRSLVAFAAGTHTGFADITEDLLDGVDHADSLGCGQIADALPDDPPPADPDSLNPSCALPCVDLASLGRGMRPTRQGLLTRGIAHAFLDATLGGDDEAALWLDAGVGLDHDDVTVEIGE